MLLKCCASSCLNAFMLLYRVQKYRYGTSDTQTDVTSDTDINDITCTDEYDIIIQRYIYNLINIQI